MRISIVAILTLVLSGAAMLFEHLHSGNYGLTHYASIIEHEFQQREADGETLTEEIIKSRTIGDPGRLSDFLSSKKTDNQKIQLLVFQSDSLIFWNNNQTFCSRDSSGGIHHLDNGFYKIIKKQVDSSHTLLALLPLKYEYQLGNLSKKEHKYLKNSFVAGSDIRGKISLTAPAEGYVPILNADHSVAFYFIADGDNVMSRGDQQILLLLWLSAFFLLAILINKLTLRLIKGSYPRAGMVFFAVAVFALKFLSTCLNPGNKFADIRLFASFGDPEKMQNASPGEMFINVLLLLWVIVFFYKNIRPVNVSRMTDTMRKAVLVLLYTAIISGILMTFEWHRMTISSPHLSFEFDDLLFIDTSAALMLLCLLLLWFALFLFNFKIISNIYSLGFSRSMRISYTLILGAMVGLILNFYNFFDLNPLGMALFVVFYIFLLDMFYENYNKFHLSWFLAWLVIFAGTTALLLYKYKRDTDVRKLTEAGKALAADVDPIALREMEEIALNVVSEKNVLHSRGDLLKALKQVSHKKGYLLDHYALSLSEDSIFAGNSLVKPVLNSDSIIVYTCALPTLDNTGTAKYYRLEASPSAAAYQFGPREHLFETPYLNIPENPRISYSIFQNKRLVKWNDSSYPALPEDDKLPAKGKIKLEKTLEYSRLIVRTDNDKVVVANIEYGGIYIILFLFSNLCIFLFGISFCVLTLNTFTRILDDLFVFPDNGSLESRVQISVISLITFACIFIGAVTILLIWNTFDRNESTNLAKKLEAVQKNIEFDLQGNENNIPFPLLLAAISETHQTDIIAYDLDGKMTPGTRHSLVRNGIISNLMNPLAFSTLSNGSNCYISEKTGEFEYRTAYGEIRKNDVPYAYFAIPYYRREWDRKVAISEFTGPLLSVYVFLLIAMIIFSYMVGEKMLRPIRIIGEKLKLVKLGQTSLDMEWKGDDALGDLIREFDLMLSNLGKEAKAEQQTARDEAWKTMARQVAHDIRNPLTPMKLSIQYLEMFTKSADIDQDIKQRVTRISGTLIEQIDTLNQIASNFADFSKTQTERPTIERVELNEFLERSCELFINDPESKIDVKLHLPAEKYFVNIDKTQMSRIITNLLTNARQAIPDEKEGEIDVYLKQKNSFALILISDNGVGIPADQTEKIFQPNFTTRSSGSGLGLAICRKLIEDIGGKIYCSSSPGKGADFYVEIPVADIRKNGNA